MNSYNLFYVFLTFLFCISAKVNAQNKQDKKVPAHQIGLSIGSNQGYIKDLNFSSLNYRESGLLYSIDYIRNKPNGKGILTIDADVSLGKLKTQASDYFMGYNTMVNLEVSYLRKLKIEKEKWEMYLGGQYNTYLQILDWNDYESFSFLATHGIGIKGASKYAINSKNSLQTSLFIPVFQNLVRPPYNGIDEKIIENQDNTLKLLVSGKPASINKYVAFDWKVNYTKELSRKLNWNVSYLLRYQYVSEINKFVHLQNQVTTGLAFKF